jgi:hypothetical protein
MGRSPSWRSKEFEPTDNAAERILRPAVQWLKICFGNHSHEGELLTPTLLTVTRSCVLQARNPFDFLEQSIVADRLGLPSPSLLTASRRAITMVDRKTSHFYFFPANNPGFYIVACLINMFLENHLVIQTTIQGIGIITILANTARTARHSNPQPLPMKTRWFPPPSIFRHIHRCIATAAQAHPIIVNTERLTSIIHPK